MEDFSPKYGSQLTIDVLNAPKSLSKHVKKGLVLAKEIARIMPVKVVGEVYQEFKVPQEPGYAICLLLDSSHIAVHCYYESQSISIDAFCCQPASGWADSVEQFVRTQMPNSQIISTLNPRFFGLRVDNELPPVIHNSTLEKNIEAKAEQVTIISPRLFNEFNEFADTVVSNIERGVKYTYVVPTDRILDFDKFTQFLQTRLCKSYKLDKYTADEKIRSCVESYVLDIDKLAIPWEMGIYDFSNDIGRSQRIGFVEHPNRPDYNLIVTGSMLRPFEKMVEQTIEMSSLGALRIVGELKVIFDNFYGSVMLLPKVINGSTIEKSTHGDSASSLINISNEDQVKLLLHLLLRSRYESIQKEVPCSVMDSATGAPIRGQFDFALPGLGVAIEVKYGQRSNLRDIVRSILYYQNMLRQDTTYHTLVVFVYNPQSNNNLRQLESQFSRTDHSVRGGLVSTHVYVRP